MDIIEKFPDGIHTVIGSKGVYLSGGEQQRIAIARAMLKNAPVLILDEATAFADPDNEAKVQAAFAELAKGKTVIMIAHRLSTVVNADCIYVVRDGQIEEAGHEGRAAAPRTDSSARCGVTISRPLSGRSQRRDNRDRKNPESNRKLPGGRAGTYKGRAGLRAPECLFHAAGRPALFPRKAI